MSRQASEGDDVVTIETHWIPLADGRRLAARLFLPRDAVARPVPVIMEYIPYRRRDLTRTADDMMHRWFAAHGYAAARVDIAGAGDSDGTLDDEYVQREQDDALEVLEHLCGQPWCSGVAGMIGMSWGGISALQVAARRPPQLKAIVTACASADRYACDAHYSGGLLLNDNFTWGAALSTLAALPPDPAVVGSWRERWRERLEDHSLFPATWLEHQRRDAFWKHGSVSEDWSAIECPVLAIGGWHDGYAATVLDLLTNLTGVCKGIIGPWGHMYPMYAEPGPAIGFLQECRRWFDQWLKGIDTRVADDDALRCYLMDSMTPVPYTPHRPGRWVGFPTWTSPTIRARTIELAECEVHGSWTSTAEGHLVVTSPLTTGLHGQEWCPGMTPGAPDGAVDQSEDDAGSLCFDFRPLDEDVSLVGAAELTLRLSSDEPQAMVAARLNSVAPDGTSSLITFAVLNLSHRRGHEDPRPLEPDRFETVRLRLKPVGIRIRKGHRLRVALSTSYWPMVWPSPKLTAVRFDPVGCSLELPELVGESDLAPVHFEHAVTAEPGPVTIAQPGHHERLMATDEENDCTILTSVADAGEWYLHDVDVALKATRTKRLSISRWDPTSCLAQFSARHEFCRGDWSVSVVSEIVVCADMQDFRVVGVVRALDSGTVFAERTYRHVVPRDCM
jgi:uncharacterized protein